MSLLDDITQEPTSSAPSPSYNFASEGIEDFVNDFKRPKLDQNINEWEDLEKLPEPETEEEDAPLEKLKATNAVANAAGSLFTTMLDTSMSTALGMYAGDDPSNYKADPDQRGELESAISQYVKLKGGDVPPGIALLLIVVSIYGSKGAMAFQFRKMKKHDEQQKKRIEDLEKQLDLAQLAAKAEPEKAEEKA